MAKPKKVVKKESVKDRRMSLWDHIKHIYEIQDVDYYEKLSDSDRRSYEPYMINRFISMNPDWIEVIDYIQKFYNIDNKLHYRLLIEFIPKGRYYIPYIKGSPSKYTKELISLISNHYEVKLSEAEEYITIICYAKDGIDEIKRICSMYGKTKKEIDEMCEM